MTKSKEEPRNEHIPDVAYRRMFLALEKGGFYSIAEAGFELLKMPIIIVNAELKKLAQFPDKIIGDPIWDKYFHEHEMTPQMTWQLLEDSIIQESERCELPVWFDRGLMEDIPRLVGNIKVDGVVEGYIGVLFPNSEYSDMHVKLTKLICQTVAIEMQKDFHRRSSRNALIIAFISDLFLGKIKKKKEFDRWTGSLKLTLASRFCVVVTAGDRELTTLHYVKNIVDEIEPTMYAAVIENKLYVLVTKLKDKITPREFLSTRVKQIDYLLSMYKLESGVSDIFEDLSYIDLYRYQAEQALNIGRISRPNDNIFLYSDIVLENIMSSIRDNIDSQNYIHPAIDILRAYDQKNGTEYLNTLKVYITSMCRPHITIETLHIHRNTLLYRLKKIEELTGTSLEDERFCALLLCNFYLIHE